VAPLLAQLLADYAATGLPARAALRCRRGSRMNTKLLALYGLKWHPLTIELPDEAAVALQNARHDFVMLFESHCLGQIERYYHERSREHPAEPDFVQPDLFRSAYPDDPPF
jgi:hypothetical protein